MAYDIRALSPGLGTVFTDYLSGLDFANTPHWASCFCRYYHTVCPAEDWMARSLETNRSEALREIEAGRMRGYLAFEDGACVGWCNANDIANFPRIYPDVAEQCHGKRVGCTICFVIHPGHRGRGLARQLLARAIADFRSEGYDAMLALPFESPEAQERRYRGTLNMYLEAGYRELSVDGSVHVMWFDLNDAAAKGTLS
ncbi:MAG: GNAT family N-acetyltransferase [Clostridiales bacterium]|nr:GNAT family N-acetyltransferase [Clostridiales bacterium]